MPHPEQPSYEELAARVAELVAVVAEQAALIGSLRAEVAALRRQAGRDSSNSSQPPSKDSPAAGAKKKAAQREARRARPGRAQGGQKGHPGASLAWTARPDETLAVEPGTCGGCGADLAGAPGRVASRVQVLDIPPAALTVTEYQMMRRTCGCGQVTTAAPPPGVTGGPVCYGPNVAAAATLLASTDVIGIERAADLMGALLGAPVSTGFVSRCLVRLDAALIAAGFEDALKDALRAADVLGTDETPAPLTTAAASAEDCGNPHVYTVRTMLAYTGGGPDLIWYGAAGQPDEARPSPGSGSWTATAGSWSATTTAATSATTPGSPGSSSASPICTGISTTPTRSTRYPRSGPGRPATPCARPPPRSGPPGPPARPAWTPASWPGCATATTRPSPSGSP